jgi:hypothetical protein
MLFTYGVWHGLNGRQECGHWHVLKYYRNYGKFGILVAVVVVFSFRNILK